MPKPFYHDGRGFGIIFNHPSGKKGQWSPFPYRYERSLFRLLAFNPEGVDFRAAKGAFIHSGINGSGFGDRIPAVGEMAQVTFTLSHCQR